MGQQDRSLRATAQPFLGQVAGYNRNEQSEFSIDQAGIYGDLAGLANATVITGGATVGVPAQDNLIRILRPSQCQIVEAHLTISLTTATAETNPYFKISVYKVTSDSDLTALTPSESFINQCMTTLTGSTTPFTNTAGQSINLDALNILPLIPTQGDANFIETCFTVGVHFYASGGVTRATPSGGAGYKLRRFQLDLSATVV